MIAAAFGELVIVLSNVALITKPALAAAESASVPAVTELVGASGATDIAAILENRRSPPRVTWVAEWGTGCCGSAKAAVAANTSASNVRVSIALSKRPLN